MIQRSAESPMPSGCFYGLARHFSGAEVAVLYQVLRSIKLEWKFENHIARWNELCWKTPQLSIVFGLQGTMFMNREEMGRLRSNLQGHRWSRQNYTWSEFGDNLWGSRAGTTCHPHLDHPHQRALCGQVWHTWPTRPGGEHLGEVPSLYTFPQGAFGSVRLAYKLEDRELVVTKFITVAKVEKSEILWDVQEGLIRWSRGDGWRGSEGRGPHLKLLCSPVWIILVRHTRGF